MAHAMDGVEVREALNRVKRLLYGRTAREPCLATFLVPKGLNWAVRVRHVERGGAPCLSQIP